MKLEKYHPDNKQISLVNPFNGRKTVIEIWANPLGQYTVRAGASSDFSYTGHVPNMSSIENVEAAIISLHQAGKIFY